MNSINTPDKQQLSSGLELLQQPVLPLISMVQFFFLTGEFSTVAEVIDEMPSPIETAYTTYDQPQELLRRHHQTLKLLESLRITKVQVTHGANQPCHLIQDFPWL